MKDRITVFFLMILLAALSCKKSAAPAPIPITPLQKLINADSSLTLYHRLLLQANEAGLLADDSVTLLIPVNTALIAAGYTELIIDSLSATTADELVKYHFIPKRVLISTADSGSYIAYNTLLGNPVYGMYDGHSVWFDGVPAMLDTVSSGKAVVYKLGALLGSPPTDSLDHLLGADTSLTFLAEAFNRTGLDSILSTGSPYTILGPTNTAFQNAGYDSLGAIDSANLGVLTNLMEYQVIPGVFFTNTLSGLGSLQTLQGESVIIHHQNGVIQFTGTNNTSPVNLLPGSQLAGTNILVYHIDQLLLP